MKSTIKFLVLTMLLILAISAFASCTALEHNWAEATCTTPKTCTDCGATEGEALGHTEQTVAGTAATCYENGLTDGKICSVCNEVLVAQKVVLSLGHDLVIDKPATATCTEAGLTAGAHCSRCDYKEEQTEVPALGHDMVTDAAVAPTCTETGLTEGSHCSRCDVKVAQEIVPATGHNIVADAAVAPTCTATGLTAGEHCTKCDYKVAQTEVPAAGHNMVTDAAVPATCTEAGLTAGEHCTKCDYKVAQTVVPALGHNWSLSEAGNTCSVCNLTVTAQIGDNYYKTFEEAYAAAKAGETIVLYKALVVNAGETLTLNKGVTITYTSNFAGEDMITNRGTLIVDGDTLVYANTDNTADNVTVSTISSEAGSVLEIKSGVVKNDTVKADGSTIYSYAIDLLTNGNLGDVTATISGGEIISTNYMAIRQFNNGTACKNSLNITGGYIYGAKRAIQVHMDNNAAYLTISGGKVEAGEGGYALCLFPKTSTNIAITGGEFIGIIYSGTNGFVSGGTFNQELYSGYCALGYTVKDNGNGTYTVDKDPTVLLINNLEELKAFRDAVNIGANYYEGVTVYLMADIDLAGENWVAIGSAYADHGFMGNFDGNGFKIKNLTITNPALDSDGYVYAGFFGVTEGIDKDNQNFIKNLVIENVTIETSGHIVSAAIAYPYYTALENITVCGDIAIKGGDYTAAALAYTRRCVDAKNITVVGNAGSYVTGRNTVGGVISDIQTNGGLVANYSNFSVSGLTVTGNKMVGGISGIICLQTLDGATVKNVTLVSGDSRVGIVAGSFGGVSTIKNIVTENVTGATAIIGSTYKDGAPVAAKIGDTYYGTLEAALAAANGETIVLVGNVALDAPIVIEKGTAATIDLAGFVLSYESTTMGEAMITNYGELTIKDSGATGEIFYNYVGANDASYGKGNYTISNSGTLVIDGGKLHIANLSAHAKYVVDNNSTTGDAILIVNGGHLYNYNTSAIRMFCNSTVYNNSVTINGGLVEGYCAIWGQNPGNKTVNGQLTITGGELKSTAKAYVNGSAALEDVSSALYFTIAADGGAWSESSFVKISGGLFNENVYLETAAPAAVEIGEGATFNGYVAIHVHDFVGFSCETDGVCSCGAIKPASHNVKYFEAVVATTCLETGNEEYWQCEDCGACFGDADASWQVNPAWLFYTGECVRPEDAADCATVPCSLCGNETYGYGEHDTGVAECQNGHCSKCDTDIEGYGCQNYDTPACEDGECYYCGGFVAGFGHENGAWAPCQDGECSYGCGLFYPATEDHLDEDGDDYCDNCWNHLNHDVNPCLGGECSICWTYVEPSHTYMFACDAHCMLCGELTNPDAAHTINFVEGYAATCTANGMADRYECSLCGYCWLDEGLTLVANRMNVVIPAPGHAYMFECDAHCMNCGELTNENAAHNITFIEGYDATCTANGMADRYECSLCGYCWLDEGLTLVANRMNVVIPATGHAYFYPCDAHCMNCYELTNPDAAHTIVAVDAKAATCGENGNVAYWYCSDCGSAWLDAACTIMTNLRSVTLPATGHADENGDYKCDNCSTKMLPADGEALTIPQALAIAKLHAHNAYTTQKYYITGIVTNVYNTTYGNLYLKDADGNQICIYGLYTWGNGTTDGTRYDKMDYKPVEGDELTVYTKLGMYNSTAQGKNAWIDEVVAHEHNYTSQVTEPTCTRDGYTTYTCTICQGYYVDDETEALGHTTENGVCDNCGDTIGGDVVNNETKTADFSSLSKNTTYSTYTTTDKSWSGKNCQVLQGGTADNSNGGTFKAIGGAAARAYVLNGKTSAKGVLTSATISGGISNITLNYANFYSESNGVDFTISIKQNGTVVASKKVDINSVTKNVAYEYTWDLAAEGVDVQGDFVIEISNNSPSNNSGNKDRVAIWNIAWTTNY